MARLPKAALAIVALAAFPGLASLMAADEARALEIFGLTLFEDEEDPEELVLDPVNYTVTLMVGTGEEELQETLEDASLLVADQDEPVSGSLGLLVKAKNDRQRLVAVLYEEARYEGLVNILIEGRPIADLPPDATFDTSRPVPVAIMIDPGPVYELGRVSITANGVPINGQEYDLVPGANASSVAVLEGEAELLRDLRDEGRPFVAITGREVIADTNTNRLEYQIALSPGEPVLFNGTDVSGAEAVYPGFIAYMADIEPGSLYSPEALDEARDRLLDLGVFSSVSVMGAKAVNPDGRLPVFIEVSERKFNYFGVGATYSNTEGFGASGYIGNRNLFGRAESIRLEASVSRIGADPRDEEQSRFDPSEIDYRASLVFRKPGVLGPESVYVGSLEAELEHPIAYDRRTINATSGIEYSLDEMQTIAVTLRGEYEEITDFLGTREYLIGSVPVTYTYDGRDDELNPTEGVFASLYLEPSYAVRNSVPFLKTRADASSYLSLTESDRFVLAGRVAYGTIFGADLLEIPNDRRFFAGGGGSVRGYTFQSIGPLFPDDETIPGTNAEFAETPTGGLSLFEASVEARIGVTENIQVVPFVDAGTVSEDLVPDFSNFKIGAGIGARYLTSFGPIRVDVAIPLDPGPLDNSFQFYAGIGQAF